MYRNGWVKWGFGPNLEDFSPRSSFQIDYRAAQPSKFQSLDLAHQACHDIADRYQEITLMLSGGVDSQALAYAFKTSGVKTRYLSTKYTGDFNLHDIADSDFYHDNDIPVEFNEINILDFHTDELFDWARRFSCHSPHILTHMKIASQIESGVAVGAGCCVTRDGVLGAMNYSVFGLQRYGVRSGQALIPFFFSYTPELHYSFSQTEVGRSNVYPDPYDWKCEIYRAAGYPVVAQPMKFHGFERLKEHFDSHHVDKATRLKYKDRPSSRPYDLLFRHPLETEIPYSEESVTLFYPSTGK